jgi:hypothetical protein
MNKSITAWMEVINQLLFLAPNEMRIEILEKALEQERERVREPFKIIDASELNDMDIPPRPSDIQAALAYTFTRTIRNNHAPAAAAKLLFDTCHAAAPGSGWMLDYLDGLPGIKVEEHMRHIVEMSDPYADDVPF